MTSALKYLYLTAYSAQFNGYVSTGIPDADDDHTLAIIASRVVKVMSVNPRSFEVLFAIKTSHTFLGMMTGTNHGSIENLGPLFVGFSVTDKSFPSTSVGEVLNGFQTDNL